MNALKSELLEADSAVKEAPEEETVSVAAVETHTNSGFSNQVAVSNVVHKEAKANRIEIQSTDETDLLDGTVWKVMLNIGREQGAYALMGLSSVSRLFADMLCHSFSWL